MSGGAGIPEGGEHLLEMAVRAAQLGGRETLRFWRHLEPGQVSEKARNDLVTEADRSSERAILGLLRAEDPGCRILAEESGATGTGGGNLWIVDPLDGTTNFVHGFPHYAVSVAVERDGVLLAGAIFDPVKDDLFTATAGGGASWNGTPCSVSARQGLEGAFLATGFPFRAHRLLDPYLAIFREVFLQSKAVRRAGAAALDLAYTAAGLFDGFFEFQLSPWDIAAGALMVREAGGVVSDMDGGDRFLKTGDVLCGPAGVHRQVLGIVRERAAGWPGQEGHQ
ncbi:MAG TPA: inositol monophosphatase [Acidobacteria bacterium]|nr:inositol monophosphatase [Acidobacteriota bacterium]